MLYRNKNYKRMSIKAMQEHLSYCFAWKVSRLTPNAKRDTCLANVMKRGLVAFDDFGSVKIRKGDESMWPTSSSDYIVYWDRIVIGKSTPDTTIKFVSGKEFMSEFRCCKD